MDGQDNVEIIKIVVLAVMLALFIWKVDKDIDFRFLFLRKKYFDRASAVIISMTPTFTGTDGGQAYSVGVDVSLDDEHFLSEFSSSILNTSSHLGDRINVWCDKSNRTKIYTSDYVFRILLRITFPSLLILWIINSAIKFLP